MKKSYIFLFITSLILVSLAFLFQKQLSQFESLGLLGIFLINLFGNATLFLPAPAIASVVAGGLVYPPILVAFFSALGGSLGDMVGFLLGHTGKKIFIKNHPRIYVVLKDAFHKFGPLVILVFAFIPNPFFDAIGILGGVFHFPAWRFFIFMFIGRIARNILLAYAGASFNL